MLLYNKVVPLASIKDLELILMSFEEVKQTLTIF